MRMDERRGGFPELETARSVKPLIEAARADIAADRELPKQLVEALTGKGLFRLLLPRSLGGSELSLPRFIRCVEVIAEADGSTGWCVGQGGVFPNVADYMPEETAEAIWGANPGAVVATGTPTGSTAFEVEEGFRLKGRWRFASGVMHASWLAAMSPIVDEIGKAIGFGMFLVRRDEITLGDGWNVQGLRGTGSRDYTLDGLVVPRPRALLDNVFRTHCGVATGLPAHLLFASAFGSVGLGIARSAVDTLTATIEGKTPTFTNRKLLDDDLAHVGLAEAEAMWGQSRSFLHDVAEECAYQYERDGEPSDRMRAQLRLSATNAMRRSAEVVDKAYTLCGTDGIFEDHPLHRNFQDIHALSQQIQARPAHFRTVGRVLLGLPPDSAVL